MKRKLDSTIDLTDHTQIYMSYYVTYKDVMSYSRSFKVTMRGSRLEVFTHISIAPTYYKSGG